MSTSSNPEYEIWFGRRMLMGYKDPHELARAYHLYSMEHLDESHDVMHYQVHYKDFWCPLYQWAEVHLDHCVECAAYIQGLFDKSAQVIWKERKQL